MIGGLHTVAANSQKHAYVPRRLAFVQGGIGQAFRLIPRFEVKEYVIQLTETENPDVTNLFIQIIPECMTESPVHECRGRLLLVSKRNSHENEWTATQMNSPLFLGWDYYGHGPFTLEPGIRQRLNVCWWSSVSHLIIPSVDPLPSKFRAVFGSGRIFKFDIRITAKDCPPVDVSVTVSLEGREWNKPIIELIQKGPNGN